MNGAADPSGLISLGAVFTLLFVTLGPLKILGPYALQTQALSAIELRGIAVRAFVLATVSVVAGGFVGQYLLQSWSIPVSGMEIAGGIIFLLVGLSAVLEQYHAGHAAPAALPPAPMAAAMRITFPVVVTPYGIAALIVLLANSPTQERTLSILAILLGIMLLNLLALLFVRRIMAGLMLMVLQVLGAVLGVLQVALAVQMILRGLHGSRVLSS